MQSNERADLIDRLESVIKAIQDVRMPHHWYNVWEALHTAEEETMRLMLASTREAPKVKGWNTWGTGDEVMP